MKRNTKISLPAHVAEMDSQVESLSIDVPFASGVNIDELIKGDSDPMFVTIEVLNPQKSRNKNKWTEPLLYEVAEQINKKKPDGFMGHLTPEELATKNPEVQTMWLGAKVQEVGGKLRLFAKGYVLPYATILRTYLSKAKSAGKKVAVSVAGMAEKKYDSSDDSFSITDFTLESIDWARSGSQGVAGMGLFQLTTEMTDGSINDQGADMDKEQIIAEMTEKDLKKHNPDLYKTIQEQATTPVEARITEMQASIVTPLQEQVSTLTGEKETAVATASKLSGRITEMLLDKEIKNRVTNTSVRKVVRKLVVSEMANVAIDEATLGEKSREEAVVEMAVENVLKSDEGKALVTEMGAVPVNAQTDNRSTEDGDKRSFTVLN